MGNNKIYRQQTFSYTKQKLKKGKTASNSIIDILSHRSSLSGLFCDFVQVTPFNILCVDLLLRVNAASIG